MSKVENQMLIIFGASGDLTSRKLIPALFDLYKGNHLAENFVVLGTSRSILSDQEFREKVVTKSKYLKEMLNEHDEAYIKAFANKIFYTDIGKDYNSDYSRLKERISSLNEKYSTENNFMF